ncbi:MAG: cyclophilin-like fold protein [Clostridiaceae bacterium]|nr:cyclophilin-like fold protein [Clostridiaceae bacterium]
MKKAAPLILLAAALLVLSACGKNVPIPNADNLIDNGGMAESAGIEADAEEVFSDEETDEQTVTAPVQAPTSEDENTETMIYAHIGDNVLEIQPEDNSSAEAFAELLVQGDVTVEMHDYGGFEKVGDLGTTLPANDENITTQPGDVILYQGSSVTIYYDTNKWSFTKLGVVRGLSQEELKAVLGDGNIVVVFSLNR